MRYYKCALISIILCLGYSSVYSFFDSSQKSKSKKSSQSGDQVQYYKKWLDEDASYIISDEEKSVYKSLKSDEERESFIEQFWTRRDKEEHYRRIAYTNERYYSGIPGWKTDRGRIYIMYGPPDQKEEHPTGGSYDRPFNEGGGTTTTYAFEKWWYRHIDGIGDDIDIEFVDPSGTGEYRIAMSPDEKDALINVPNAGLTQSEEMGLSEKTDRPYFNPSAYNDPNNPQTTYMRAKDSPFSRMEQYFSLQKPPQIKFDDLKIAVSARVSYNTLPYAVRTDYIWLTPSKVLMPITIELNNSNLEFKRELGVNRASVNVYGIVRSLTGRIMYEFEDVISSEFSDQNFQQGKNKRAEYQKIIALPPGQRFKVDLLLKDVNSKNQGSDSIGISIPKYEEQTLQSSTIILADSVSRASSSSDQMQQFVIGDMKIIPNVTSEYLPGGNLISYIQIYNMAVDQTNLKPSLEISLSIKKGDKIAEEFKNASANIAQYFYGQRVVVLTKVPLTAALPGTYTLEMTILDSITNRKISTSTDFKVKEKVQAVSAPNP